MKIFDIAANSEHEALILPLVHGDHPIIKSNKQFVFNWQKPKGTIYKLIKKGNPEILGIMSIIEHSKDTRDGIEIELLEVGKKNVGEDKEVDRIAGCLIAYACRESIKTGHEGWVFLVPKTVLGMHYVTKYGFMPFGVCIASSDQNSLKIIKKYL